LANATAPNGLRERGAQREHHAAAEDVEDPSDLAEIETGALAAFLEKNEFQVLVLK
jgi:hypothetical protein